jgi:ferritin-like metal-binding protein YciE
MAIKDLNQKFIHDLGAIYDAEHQFLEAQQQMVQQAQNSTVKTLLQEHITQTEQQIQNLEQVYSTLGEEPKRIKCQAAAGLVADGQKFMKEASDNPAILDTVMAGAQAKVEHFEMACYRGLVEGARLMGQDEILQLLQQNLQQEEQTAQRVEKSMPQLLQQAMSTQERGR